MIISLNEKIIQIQVDNNKLYCLTSAGNVYVKYDNYDDLVLLVKSSDKKVKKPFEKSFLQNLKEKIIKKVY